MAHLLQTAVQLSQQESGGMRKQKDNKLLLEAAGKIMEVTYVV